MVVPLARIRGRSRGSHRLECSRATEGGRRRDSEDSGCRWVRLSLLILGLLVMLGWTLLNVAHACGYGCDVGDTFITNNFHETNVSYHLDDDAIDSIMAGAMAADAISFSAHTRKKQFGIGLGHYRGENSLALGFGKMIETDDYEILLSVKGSYIDYDEDVAVGVGATIEVD